MPAKSRQQYKFFKAMENNSKLRKEKGISEDTVKDYTKMSKGRWKKLKEYVSKKDK
jgi:hypothetical protein